MRTIGNSADVILNTLGALKRISYANRLFFVLALVFGLLMIHIVPPVQAPDEIGHFIKAYAFSEEKVKPQAYNKKLTKTDSTWGNFGFEVPYEMKSMNSYAIDTNGKDAKYPYQYKVDEEKSKKGRRPLSVLAESRITSLLITSLKLSESKSGRPWKNRLFGNIMRPGI